MGYAKTVWVNGQAPAINATNLNKIEQQLFDLDSPVFDGKYMVDASEVDQGQAGNGKSVKDYIDSIGTTKKALLVFLHTGTGNTTTYTFSTNETTTSNITCVFLPGAIADIDNGVTLTINGPFECGLCQVFSGAGAIAFGKGAIQTAYPQWWGALEGVANNCASAINSAIASGPATGYTIEITYGVWRFTSKIDFGTKMHHLIGNGWGSVLYADVGASTNAIEVGVVGTSTTGFSMRNLMVLGPASACLNAVVLNRTHAPNFKDVLIQAGAVEYGLWVNGCIYGDYDGVYMQPPPAAASQPTWARPANGVKVTSITTVMQSNVTKLKVYLSLFTGNGIYLDGSTLGYNRVDIRGAIEYVTGTYVIYANDIDQLRIHDLYGTDGNTGKYYFANCDQLTIGPNFKSYASGLTTELVACKKVEIHRAGLGALDIDSSCINVTLGNIKLYDLPGITDAGIGTIYRGPIELENIATDPLQNTHIAQDFHNYFSNSNFERWQTDRPATWDRPGTVTWTVETTTIHSTTNSAKASSDTPTTVNWVDPDQANFLLKAKGKWVSFGIWVYQDEAGDATPSVDPRVRIRVTSAGSGNLDNYTDVTTDNSVYDSWVYHYISAYVLPDSTAVEIAVLFDETIFIAEPCLMIGSHNQYGWVQEWNEHNEHVAVAGGRITFGAAAPVANWWCQGDVCFNTGAAAAGKVGWVCVVAGAPGTWKPFGVIDT